MSVVERFTRLLQSRQPGQIRGQVGGRDVTFTTYVSACRDVADVSGWTAERLWATQPHLRTVVDFIASTVAGMGVHVYQRELDDRHRVRDGVLAQILTRPNAWQTGDELLYALAHEIALYDDAFLLVGEGEVEGTWQMALVPCPWVYVEQKGVAPDRYFINGNIVPADRLVRFPGWTPGNPGLSTSRVDALRDLLAAEAASQGRRKDVLVKGPRVGGVIQRPRDAATWSDEGRHKFDEMWRAFQPGGPRSGDAVLLEDGMTYAPPEFDASASGYRDGAHLSLATCAQVFQLHPSLVGSEGGSHYSSVREFNRALVANSLAWMLRRIQSRLTSVLGPMIGEDSNRFVEFNVESRLRGSFEEQAAVLRQSVGGPYMTRNEARRRQNLPAVDGGDELITPMNVTVEGESHRSPEDDSSQADGIARASKAGEVVERFAERRTRVVRSRVKAGAARWWDGERWNRELAADLKAAGVPPGEVDVAAVNERARREYAREAGAS